MQTGIPLLPEQASTISSEVDGLYFFLVGLTVFFSVLIAGAIVYFAIKYRRRSPHEIPRRSPIRALFAHSLSLFAGGFVFSSFFLTLEPAPKT